LFIGIFGFGCGTYIWSWLGVSAVHEPMVSGLEGRVNAAISIPLHLAGCVESGLGL